MSTYCPHCSMLTYNDERCEYCNKPLSKINELQDKAKNTKFSPQKVQKTTRYMNTNNNQIICETCGHEISTKTIQCPSCGEIKFWKLIGLIIKVGVLFSVINLAGYIIAAKIMGF